MSLDLEKQLKFYGAYHHNKVNIGIHVACVPLIMATSFLLASNSPNLPVPDYIPTIPNLPINLGTVAAFLYGSLYILMEPVAGALLFPFIMGGAAAGNYLLSTYGATASYWAGALNIVSWIAQFVGHGKYEGRAPALLDNLVQALFLAPFFVWFEVLFSLGYRPDLKARLDKAVDEEIRKFKKPQTNGAAKKEI
ncbi:DUF962-domain-containing protein [Tothia fuscella]|uniref:DUF962-domain-containing protein n=1 Tax=Tothia fuscella TaxID=1048955 RepID=A0A9P4U512_9PEZI|nr:DUF962-domain-containing protein [Tothia fuscella]